MSMLTRAMIAATLAAAAGLATAMPAAAQPGPPPCEFALSFICNLVPMAPELDHNVDLTEQLPPADPNAPLPESLPPLNPCAAGCI
jgi:hypothetical protein